jgi:4-amino-4-deoxy-L-arabinose transferase-like glycosyltransferase
MRRTMVTVFWEACQRLEQWPRSRFLVFLIALSFLVRAGAVAVLRDPYRVHGPETNFDGVIYHQIAVNLARGEGYVITPDHPTRYWMPGFPLLLAGIYRAVGERPVAVYLSLCVLGAIACLVAYLLGVRLHGEWFGRVASLLCAVYVPHIYLASLFLSENLFAVTVGVAAFCAVRFVQTGRWRDLTAAAVAAGLGVLTRPFLIVGAVGFAVWLLLRRGQTGLRKLQAFVYLCGVLIVLSPWVVRNYLLDARIVVLTTGAGVTFHGANNDVVLRNVSRWGTWIPTSELPEGLIISQVKDEWVRDRMHWQFGLRWVREHWMWQPALALARFVRFWLPDFDSANRAYVAMQIVTYTPFLLLLVTAVPVVVRRTATTGEWVPVQAFLAASVVAAVIFWGGPRFRDGNAPLLALYAALGAERMIRGAAKRRIES